MARLSWLWVVVLVVVAAGADTTIIEWKFDRPGDLKGWQPNNHLADVKVGDGELRGRASDWDPFLTSPPLEIPARPWQVVELELRTDKPGRGDLFWTNTLKTQYEGFSPDKHTPFDMAGGDGWQTIRISPFWHAEKKIIKLRIDLVEGQSFALKAVRVVEPPAAAMVTQESWDFTKGAQGWTASGLELKPGPEGLAASVAKGGSLRSPLLAVPIADQTWVAVRLRSRLGQRASLIWATSAANGLQRVDFPIVGDGRWHTYHVDIGSYAGWAGQLLALGLEPSRTAGDDVVVGSLALVEEPIGGPDVQALYFGPIDAVARVGKPIRFAVKLNNLGGASADGLKVEVTPPAGVRLAEPPAPLPSLEFQVPAQVRFSVVADRPVDGAITARVTGPGAPATTLTAPLKVTAGPSLSRADYVPVPRPCPTKYKIGTYYFPGWATGARWEPIDRVAPQRRPVLGWYDESSPEVVDWQIKWAVEHGISFFLVDWYWSAGNTNLMHWLEAFEKARYKNQLQWAVMWANHNAPNTHSEADWRKVTQFWIEHYLKQPNYLKVDGKPAVYLWSPHNIRRDMGSSEAVKKLFAISQEMARAAGLPGISFVAMNEGGSEAAARQLAAETYQGNATYHWWADAASVAADSRNYPYSLVVERSRQGWQERRAPLVAQGLFYQPTADTGWDARPWHGDKSFVIGDRTPALFERLLRDAKTYLDQHGEETLILGPWNEWGEGSYIEPNLEYGFDMLEAVRRVFCEPGEHTADVVPIDLGLGPYDLTIDPPVLRTAWTFDQPSELQGWHGMMGMADVGIRDGALYGRTTTQDPAFGGPNMSIRAKDYPYLLLRLKATPGAEDGLQIFWSTVSAGTSEESSIRTKLQADGQYHDYLLSLADCPRWRGVIRQFRIDPGSKAGVEIWIDEIKLAKEKPAG